MGPRLLIAFLVSTALAGCFSTHEVDGGPPADGGVDSGTDTGSLPDTGADTGGPARCEGLTEAECVGRPECAPLYDDFCCPGCVPIGACADCYRPQMYRCVRAPEACSGAECGFVSMDHCAGAIADCSSAMVVAGNRCDVPGCVAAIDPSCADDCPVECVPVQPALCTAFCDLEPPPCPVGMAPEADGGCFTGRCIAASACEPASAPAP
jgi:hypothetical protein